MFCGNNPNSWVRRKASLDPSSGMLTITVQLETDSTTAGPKGKVFVALKDANGKTLATADSVEVGRRGKPPGKAVIQNFSSQKKIDPGIAQRVKSMYMDAQRTGSVDKLWNIDLSKAMEAFQIVIAIIP